MIVTYLIKDEQTEFNDKLSKLFLKILQQENSPIILSYLISNIDKQSEEFTTLCKLKYLQDTPLLTETGDIEQLERSLG